MRKILCNCIGTDGSECNRWLARVEGAYVFTKCPRCRGYHKEPLVNFIDDLQKLLDRLRDEMGDSGSTPGDGIDAGIKGVGRGIR